MATMKFDPEKAIVTRVCEELVAERKRQGISQQRLSEDAGISRTGLRHIESLNTSPSLYMLLKVAKALKVDLSKVVAEQSLL